MSVIKNTPAFYKRAFLSLCTGSTLFLWVPLYVVYLSINDINFNIFDFFISSLVISLVASLVFLAGTSLLARLGLGWLGSLALYGILSWASLAGFMLPLVQQAGMVSPEDLVTNWQNVVLVAGSSLLLTLLTLTRLKAATQAFLLILTLTTVGGALPSLLQTSASFSRFTSLSSEDNVLVLSFDGLAGNVVKHILQDDPELKHKLKDLVFYDNAIAAAPATWASIRSELYGNFNYKIDKDAAGNLLTVPPGQINTLDRERASKADIVSYGAYSTWNNDPADRITPLTLGVGSFTERAATALDLSPYIAARIGTAWTARFVDQDVMSMIPLESLSIQSRRSLEHRGAKWDGLGTLHSDDLVMFMDNLHVVGTQRNVRYLHLLHTHFPVDLDQNCTYRSADAQWFAANQNYQGVYNETHCALRQTAQVIDKLKAIGVYDQTLLVVKSDHGAPVSYMDTAPDDNQINNNAMWGYNRYRPLMMIKDKSHESETMTYNSSLVSLSDLARTLCPPAVGEAVCARVPGLDLLHPDTPANATDKSVFIEVVVDEQSTFNSDTHLTIEVPRAPDFLASLEANDQIKLNNENSLFTQRKADLRKIKAALEAYRAATGKYPVSESYDGLHSAYGKDTAEWISGLTPAYISHLPLDPARSSESMPQYLYRSDGNDYKVIAHGETKSCLYAKEQNPELVDPARDCWGFGYWTDAARNW